MRNLALCFLLATLLAVSGCTSGSKVITVNVASPSGAQALDLGQSFNITVSVSNDPLNKGVTWTLSGVGALSNQTATGATYTAPATGNGGSATVTITSASDTSKSITLSIVVTAPPSITTASLAAAVMGTSYSGTVAVTGGAGTLNYSVTIGSLPAGLTLNATSGAITGTATGPTGTVNFTIQVKDSSTVSPQSTTKAFSITINQAPAITSANNTPFTAGVAGSFTVTTTGTAPITITETGALPTGVTFKDNGDGTGTLSGTAATAGAYPITFTASNGFGTNATQNFTLNIQQAAAITSAASTTFTVGTAGTFSVTTSGFPTPSLTETGALPTGVTFKDNGNGTATLAGTPAATTTYTYSFSVKATNSLSTATQNFTLTVDQGPGFTCATATTFTIGVAGTFAVTTSGFPIPALTETGALPTGVTFVDNGNGTATLAGTPTGTAGNYSLTFKAHNGIGTDETITFTLTVGQAPAITSGNASTFTVGTAGTFTVTATGFPVPTLTETGAPLPTGVTFTAATGILAGTPAAGTGGTYSLTFTAHNGAGTDATQTFTLTVNQAPAITSAPSAAFWIGNLTSFTVTTTGLPLPVLTETGALPNGVTFVDNHNGTATLAGVPATGTYGNYPLTLKATNSVSTATQSFTLSVVTPAAITSANSTTFTVGTLGTFSVTTLGSPSPSLTETGALPSGITFVDNGNGTATLTGTPAAGTGGAHSLTITAHNGIGSDYIQSFTLNVNEAPAITSANHATFTVGAAGTFTVTTTGTPLPSLTETGALPGSVTFTDNGNGTATLAGTPSASGTFTLTLKATNVVSSANQTFTLTVDTAPVITSANNATFVAGSPVSFTVTTTGTPIPSITETGTLPNGVTFTDNGNGTASLGGTLASGTGGIYTLTFKAHNGLGTDPTQTFTLTVNQAPSIFSANSTTFTLGTPGTFTVSTTGYPTPSLSETGALPSGVSFTDNGTGTATLAGTPAAGGTFTLTLKATNLVSTATQTFTLTVTVPPLVLPAPNPTSLGPATINQAYSGSINVSGGAPGYTWTVAGNVLQNNGTPVALSDGLSASTTGGTTLTISGTPTSTATVSFPVTVEDSTTATAGPFTYTIQVNSLGSQVSGQIFLNNQCGGSSGNQPLFTVSINTSPVQTTTTDTNGNYSFATVPNGTYTITPSITGASSLFSPATLTNVVVSNNSVSGENFSAEVGYTVSGTVTYSASGTPQTGQTYISVTGGCNGGNGGPGTSLSEATLTSGGAYTIRGVPPGTYTVQAWMDPLGQSVQNAIDPTGSASVTVTDANVTGAAITMQDPTFATPNSDPTIQGIIPNAQGVLIEFKPSQNSNSVEDANRYLVQWSTSPTLGGGTGGGQFAVVAGSHSFTASGDNGVWILTNALSGVSFTSGQTYYFQARSFNDLDTANPHPTGWCNYTATGCSGTTGFTAVKIATPACTGTCTAVSSSVTIPAAITIKAGAPLYLGMIQLSGAGGNPIGIYVTEIAHPTTGANDFTVTVPSGSNYAVLGILDQNNTGGIGVGAITNVRKNVQANLTISGTTQNVAGITLPTSNSTASVSTQFSSNSCQGCGSPSTGYQLNFNVSESDKLPVAVVLNSGPNVLNTSGTVALDMSLCSECGNPQFGYSVSLLGTPNVGDSYGFTVTYSDGTQDTGTTVTAAVSGWNGGSSIVAASDAPSALAPIDTNSTSTTPTFTWTDSASSMGASFYYTFYISQSTGCSGSCNIWQIPGNNSKSNGFSSSTTSIIWGTDPTGGGSTPSVGSLTSGTTYNWAIQVQDSNSNSAQITVWYQP